MVISSIDICSYRATHIIVYLLMVSVEHLPPPLISVILVERSFINRLSAINLDNKIVVIVNRPCSQGRCYIGIEASAHKAIYPNRCLPPLFMYSGNFASIISNLLFFIYLYYINLHIISCPPHLGVDAIYIRIEGALNHLAFLVSASR